MNHAIIVVDIQKDFVEGGSLAVAGGQDLANTVSSMVIPVFREALPDSPILFTKDWHIDPGEHFSDTPDFVDSWPPHCVAETEGANFAATFGEEVGGVFRKGQYQASYSGAEGVNIDGETLVEALDRLGVERVDIIGIAFDYCVKQTALDLAAEGFETNVVKYFTRSVHPENDANVIADLEAQGVRVMVTKPFGGTYA